MGVGMRLKFPNSARAVLEILLLRDGGYRRGLEYVDMRLAVAIFSLYIYSRSLPDMLELNILGSPIASLLLSFLFQFPLEMAIIYMIAHFITGPSPNRKRVVRERFWNLFRLLAIASIPAIFEFVSGWLWLWSFACWVKAAVFLSDFQDHKIMRGVLAVVLAKLFVGIVIYAVVGFLAVTVAIVLDVVRERNIFMGSFWAVLYLFSVFPFLYGIYIEYKRKQQ